MATPVVSTHSGTSNFKIQDPWSCLLCDSGDVKAANSYCEKCQQTLHESLKDQIIGKLLSAWQCPRCTLFNKIHHEECNACGMPKLSSVNSSFAYHSNKILIFLFYAEFG